MIKRTLFGLSLLGLVLACNKKAEEEITVDNPLTQEDIQSYSESSSTGADEIDYEGTYSGKVKGVQVELKLKDDNDFELSEGNVSYKGKWWKLDDGTVIELEPESGSPKTKQYMWSDNDNWIGLNADAEVPEVEEFITRK